MNWDQIEGNWKQVKGKFRETWGKLTDDDLDVVAGKRDQLLGKLQEKYGSNERKRRRNWMSIWANGSSIYPDANNVNSNSLTKEIVMKKRRFWIVRSSNLHSACGPSVGSNGCYSLAGMAEVQPDNWNDSHQPARGKTREDR